MIRVYFVIKGYWSLWVAGPGALGQKLRGSGFQGLGSLGFRV